MVATDQFVFVQSSVEEGDVGPDTGLETLAVTDVLVFIEDLYCNGVAATRATKMVLVTDSSTYFTYSNNS